MAIVTPRRRRIFYSHYSRQRYSNFKEWLDREGVRLATTARAVRDSIKRLGAELPADVEAAADATPADINVKSNDFEAGGVTADITAGVLVNEVATTWDTLGFVAGDEVEITYSGVDFPIEERYFATVSAVTVADMTVAPAPPDNAWPATTDVNVSSLSPNGRE